MFLSGNKFKAYLEGRSEKKPIKKGERSLFLYLLRQSKVEEGL